MEREVDALVVRQDVAIPHAAPQQGLDPVAPVRGDPLHLDLFAAQAAAVGIHGDGRGDDRDRVAGGDGEGGVREGRAERNQLLQVLGRLENPALPAVVPLEDLQDLLHVGVGGGLVARQIVVA